MKKINSLNIFIGVGLVIIILIGGWLFFPDKIEKPIFQEEVEIFQENIKNDLVLIIDDGQDLSQLFEVEFKEGITVFDLLQEGVEKLDLILKTKSYDVGVFIEAIGNKENGQEEKYWIYYLNEEMSLLAADKQLLGPGDKVEFRFETSPF